MAQFQEDEHPSCRLLADDKEPQERELQSQTERRADLSESCKSSLDDDSDLTVDEQDPDGDQEDDLEQIRSHPSYRQVLLDVNRCAGRLEHIRKCYLHRTDHDDDPPEDLSDDLELERFADVADSEPIDPGQHQGEPMQNISEQEIMESEKLKRISKDLMYQRKLKRKLAALILRLLIKKPQLHYYQGFHDVCLTYMTIYGYKEAMSKLDSIIDSHFSAFMQPTMNETQDLLSLIQIIIGLQDSRVRDFLERAEVGTIFSLSWVITWFSHVIPNERDVEQIYIYLESNEDPHLILYLCAAIVLYKSNQLLELEPEMSTVHKFLTQIPRKEKLPIGELLVEASQAMRKWPPINVIRLLDKHRREKLQVHNYNLIESFANRFIPGLVSAARTSNTRTAIIVFVVASAFALQLDRWIR